MSTIILPEQFQDTKEPFNSTKQYSLWFNKEKNNCLQTIPFKKILQASDYGENTLSTTKLFSKNKDSIYTLNPGLNNYSIYHFRYELETLLHPFALLSLFCSNVHLKIIELNDVIDVYAVGVQENTETTLAVSFATRKIYNYKETNILSPVESEKNTLSQSKGSSFEYIFKKLHLPISIVMNSVFMGPDDCPYRSHLISNEKDNDLYKRMEKITGSKEYDEAVRTNEVYKSKVFKK